MATIQKKRSLIAFTAAWLLLDNALYVGASGQALDLDLSSTDRSVAARRAGQILVGDTTRSIEINDLITPAERIALWQANNGGQNLILSGQGSAIGGSFNVTDRFSPTGTFVIPAGVTAIQTASSLNLSGNLTNSGNLYAVPQNLNAVINAANIMNNVGGIISSMPPVNSGILAPGAVDLSLVAAMNIVNAGQIISSANLNMTAGGSIINSLPTGVSAATPVIQAMNNINLVTGVNNSIASIINAGTINSIAGNINFNSTSASNLLINNTGGTLLAQLGSINVRDGSFIEKFNLDLFGGDIITRELNLWSGNGILNVDVNTLSGQVNASTGIMHLNAATPDLMLGSIQILGDPTFFNQGNIQINNNISAVGALAIIASGNITSTAGGSINTTQPAGAGGNVIIMAGTSFSTAPPTPGSATTSGQNGGAGDNATVLTIAGGTTAGGFVDLSNLTTPGGATSALQTTATAGSGGNVTIVAFPGTAANAGVITTNGLQGGILTGGGGGNNGNVVMIAGAGATTAINAGSINTAGTAVNLGGEVVLMTGVPTVQAMTINNGMVANNSVLSSTTLVNSSISVGSISTNAVPVTIIAGNGITLNGSITTDGNPAIVVNGPGGHLGLFAGGNIATGANAISVSTAGGSGNHGGSVVMLAGANMQAQYSQTFNVTGDTINSKVSVSGPSAAGGFVDMTGGGTNNLNSISTIGFNAGAGFAGGHVQVVAFAGSGAGTGIVTFPAASTISTYGLSNGNSMSNVINTNGNLSIFAGNNSGAATTSISLGAVNTFDTTNGSNAGAGNITIATAQVTPNNYVYLNGAESGTLTYSTLTSSSISLNGVIRAEGGSVLLPAPANGVNTTQTTSILVQSGQNLTVGANISNLNTSLPAGNLPGGCGPNCNGIPSANITLSANGTLTFTGGPIISASAAAPNPANGQGIDGGTISLQAASFSGQGSLTADATGGFVVANGSGGNGGQIFITGTGTGAAGTINLGPTSMTVSAQGAVGGGNGGKLTVVSASNIAIDGTGVFPLTLAPQAGSNSLVDPLAGANTLVNSGIGPVITLTAAGTLAITGAGLDASGAASNYNDASQTGNPGGNGGQIFITVNSSTAFDIGAAAAPTNGIQGILSANGSTIAPTMTSAFGTGGLISVTNLGGGIIVESNSLSVQAAAANKTYHAGYGGTIILNGTTVFTKSGIDASGGGSSAAKNSGNGGSITITTNSSTQFEIGTPTGSNGVTGTLTANGNVVGSGTPPAGPATLPMPNVGTGGAITVNNNGTGGILIDATGNITVLAASATTNFPAGNGGSINLNAPMGPVLSQVSLAAIGGAPSAVGDVDAGVGGTISITSNSSNPFVIGTLPGVPVAGVSGSITVDGYSAGTIYVSNLGSGGIQVDNGALSLVANSAASATSFGGNGGTLTLNASGGPLAVTGNLDVSGASGSNFGGMAGFMTLLSNSSTTLSIGSSATSNFISGNLTANGGTGTAGNGDAGTINITNNSGGINIASNSVLVTAPDATLSGYAGSGGHINIQAPQGEVIISGDLHADGGKASTTSAYSAGFGGTLTILENSTNTFDINGTSTGKLTANGWSGGTISVTNNGAGGITVENNGISVTAGAAQYKFPANPLQFGQNATPGPGGTVNLSAPTGKVTVNGTIDVSGGAIFQQTPTNTLNAGTSIIDVGSTSGFAIGQTVTITDGTNTETQVITGLSANTSITVAPLANNYGASVTVSAYSLSQTATNTSIPNVLNNATNPLPLTPGTTTLTMADTTGYIALQTVQLSNPEFNQTATNIPAVQSNSTIAVADTSGFGIGQTVTIAGNSLSETQVISGVNPGVSITVDVTNTYTTFPTVTANAVSETQQITSVNPGVSINITPTTKTYAVTPPVLSVTNVLNLPSSQGFIQNQAVSISSGATSEVQFIGSISGNSLIFSNLFNTYTNPTVTAFTANGTVNIQSSTGITQAPGATINANTLNITGGGNIGTTASPLQVNILANGTPGTLTLSTAGAATINNSTTTAALGNIQTGSGFSFTSNGSIFSNSLISSQGPVSLTNGNTTFGDIFVNNLAGGTAITAAGSLLIQNNNLAGAINIANPISSIGSTVITSGPLGPLVAGTTPPTVTASSSNGSGVFFGTNGIVAGPGVTIGATNGNVVFNGATPTTITLSGGISINTLVGAVISPPAPTPPILGSAAPPPLFSLNPNLTGARPFGTIISTDQTPESDPDKFGQLDSKTNSVAQSALAKQLAGFTQLMYFQPNLETNGQVSFINMPTGNGLVFAKTDTEIRTPLATFTLDRGSAVLIFQSANSVALLNLHDDHQGSVFAVVDGSKMEVPIGRQIVVSNKHNLQFDDLNPSAIGYRQLSSITIGTKRVFTSEFSALSALTSVLKVLDKHDKEAQLIAQRMLKSAAAVFLLGQQQRKPIYKSSKAN
ncbi:MAG: hypothetical protein K2X77_15260 [Candidatus Obscuribacterales bacterium]|nr:hypothetical protein [Candidatus Obscuribacterales bacterium]